MKLFQLTIPNEKHAEIVSHLQDDMKIDNVTSVEARTSSIVIFRVSDSELQAVLTSLQAKGVGVDYGFCDVMSLTPGTSISTNKKKKKKRIGNLLMRSSDAGTAVPVVEMYARIDANASLSRDSLGMLIISSSLAGIGLAGDSSGFLVASMLLSPLMGPILGCAFGFTIRDKQLFISGFLNEILALIITFLLGLLIGAAFSPYADVLKWPTSEMKARGQSIQIFFGAIAASLSGSAVALAESNADISSVVGTAIAAALLTPTINCGICLSFVLVGQYFISNEEARLSEDEKIVYYEISVGSALLVFLNILFIYISAVFIFMIKRVGKFRIARRVNEKAWQDLPKLGKTPRYRRDSLSKARFGLRSIDLTDGIDYTSPRNHLNTTKAIDNDNFESEEDVASF